MTRLSHGIRKWALPTSAASVAAGDEGKMIMVALHGRHSSSYHLHPGAGAWETQPSARSSCAEAHGAERAVCTPFLGSGYLRLSAGLVTTFMSLKHRESKSLSRDLSCCRECVRGELGRGCNDENKSVCVNNKGKMMMRLISKALPFKRRVSLG